MKAICILVVLALSAAPAGAQWLSHKTPGLPRKADGKVNTGGAGAAHRRRQTGLHRHLGVGWRPGRARRPRDAPRRSRRHEAVGQGRCRSERGHDYFKSRPDFMCRPSGVEAESPEREKRILQTPAMIAVLNANQTYRQIFLDGRTLEKDPAPMWQGFSVGRWEGDTLVVESNGFNDRTWLNNVGLPHTEKLRVTERYRRPTLGRLERRRDLHDPDAYNKPLTLLAPDAAGHRHRDARRGVRGQAGVLDRQRLGPREDARCRSRKTTMKQVRRLLRRVLAGQPSQGDDVAQGRRAARHGSAAVRKPCR